MLIPLLTNQYFEPKKKIPNSSSRGYFLPVLHLVIFSEKEKSVAILSAIASRPVLEKEIDYNEFDNPESTFYTGSFNISSLIKLASEEENGNYNSVGMFLDSGVFTRTSNYYKMDATLVKPEVLHFLMGRPSILDAVSKMVNIDTYKKFKAYNTKYADKDSSYLETFGNMAIENKEGLSNFLQEIEEYNFIPIFEEGSFLSELSEGNMNVVKVKEDGNISVNSEMNSKLVFTGNLKAINYLFEGEPKLKKLGLNLAGFNIDYIYEGYSQKYEGVEEKTLVPDLTNAFVFYKDIFVHYLNSGTPFSKVTSKDIKENFKVNNDTLALLSKLGFMEEEVYQRKLKKAKEDNFLRLITRLDFNSTEVSVDEIPTINMKYSKIKSRKTKVIKSSREVRGVTINLYASKAFFKKIIDSEINKDSLRVLLSGIKEVLSYVDFILNKNGLKEINIDLHALEVLFNECEKVIKPIRKRGGYMPSELSKKVVENTKISSFEDKELVDAMVGSITSSLISHLNYYDED